MVLSVTLCRTLIWCPAKGLVEEILASDTKECIDNGDHIARVA